jgi:hypothetical protein
MAIARSEVAADETVSPRARACRIQLQLAPIESLLAKLVLVLTAGSFAAQLLKWRDRLPGVRRFLDSDVKTNLPSSFKVLTLLASTILVAGTARVARQRGERFARQWALLAAIIGFLTFDEMNFFHQSLNDSLAKVADGSGVLSFKWQLVYLPLAVLATLCLRRFLVALPPATRTRFVLAGLLFGGGSGVLEFMKGSQLGATGGSTLGFYLTAALSDTLEMVGLSLLVSAAYQELAARVDVVQFSLREAVQRERQTVASGPKWHDRAGSEPRGRERARSRRRAGLLPGRSRVHDADAAG